MHHIMFSQAERWNIVAHIGVGRGGPPTMVLRGCVGSQESSEGQASRDPVSAGTLNWKLRNTNLHNTKPGCTTVFASNYQRILEILEGLWHTFSDQHVHVDLIVHVDINMYMLILKINIYWRIITNRNRYLVYILEVNVIQTFRITVDSQPFGHNSTAHHNNSRIILHKSPLHK